MPVTTKIALVTGGSRGLGKDMAISLAAKGIDVILTYRNKDAEARETVKAIEGHGRKAAALQLDMADFNSLDQFVESVVATLKATWQTTSFDFLVNNAGMGATVPFE
jgi:NAD(P)-dependent dehydrogenase (short-subunit alcohol dehydrogenase family)